MTKGKSDVLKLWFGDLFWDESPEVRNTVSYIQSKYRNWFTRADAELNDKLLSYAPLLPELEENHINKSDAENPDWSGPHGVLAKIIVFDQLNRTINSGTVDGYKYDKYAVECGHLILANDWWKHYSVPERMFIHVAFQHSENLADHDTADQLEARLTVGYDCPELVAFLAKMPYAAQHREVLERFGRYPGRNQALGRVSTPEEEAFLSSPDCYSWAKTPTK